MKFNFQNIKSSLHQRKQIRIASVRRVIIFTVIFLIIYLVLALVFAPENKRHLHFDSERGAITVLSAIMLAMSSFFAGGSFLLLYKIGRFVSLFWLLIGVGFGYLAIDELFEIHEKLCSWIDNSAIGPTQIFRNWNDVIVIIYCIAAVLVLTYFLSEVLRYPLFAEIQSTALILFFIHTIIDTTQQRSPANIILEESAKIFSSTFFAISMYVGFLGVLATKKKMKGRS